MGEKKRTVTHVFMHVGLELQDALLGLLLGDWEVRGSGCSDRVQSVDGGRLQRGKQGLDLRVLGGRGGSKLAKGCTTVCGGEARLSKWPSNCSIISSEERGMAGRRPVGGWVGDAAEMTWAAMARLAEPKESPR